MYRIMLFMLFRITRVPFSFAFEISKIFNIRTGRQHTKFKFIFLDLSYLKLKIVMFHAIGLEFLELVTSISSISHEPLARPWDMLGLIGKVIIMLFEGMKKYESMGKKWHDECFVCVMCKKQMGNQNIFEFNMKVICGPCYDEYVAKRCTSCKKVCSHCPHLK